MLAGHPPAVALQVCETVTETNEIANRTASEIGLAFRSGESDPVALTEYLLERIDKASDTKVFITVMAERARREAQAAANRYREGRPASALDGVPIAWKDLFDVAGSPTTAASSLYRDSPVRDRDLGCVANTAAAGMVCLGKLNMTELAYSGLGLNPHFGTPLNPNDNRVHRSPGGSSSGSGAAVAGGLLPCAIGTDTGGSVRIPASLNGVFGYKSSEGRIDKAGMIPLSRTLDTIGVLARSVEDCILVDTMLRGAVIPVARRMDLAKTTIFVPENFVMDACEDAVLDNFEESIRLLERAGARIERRIVPEIDEVARLTAEHGSLTAAEAYHEYNEIVDGAEGSRIDARVVHRIKQGGQMSANDLLCIQDTRKRIMGTIADLLDGALLAMPTTPLAAPEVAPLDADSDLFHKINLMVLRNTMIGNFLGFCGLAIPNGRDGNDLPTSILFSALLGRDDFLLGQGIEIARVLQCRFQPTWTRY